MIAPRVVLTAAHCEDYINETVTVGCHDYGKDSPVHAMLAGRHGSPDNEGAPMGQGGCEDCHGPSAAHARAPTRISPGVSFGPRWTASIADQDKQCLACHGEDALARWHSALHMVNDLTCVTCHDIHQPTDKVLAEATQSEVCTTCHKVQKAGIHGLGGDEDPACTRCHNPHDDSSPAHSMLTNRSEGCRSCHNLALMAESETASAKAISYHKVMVQPDRTCLDCHSEISHGPADAVAPMTPEARSERSLTLFYPGDIDREWLLSDHPGAQPFRQGRNCQQCHRGEEANMGAILAGDFTPASRVLDLAFTQAGDELQITVSWDGPPDDARLSFIWGDYQSPELERGACFAACHESGKYLPASLSQTRSVGRPAMAKSGEELQAMLDAGHFGEMWRVDLASGEVETARLLEKLHWQSSDLVNARASHANGHWTVSLKRSIAGDRYYKTLEGDERYTFGLSLNGARNPDGQHWVSLPLTLRFSGGDTDFKAQ